MVPLKVQTTFMFEQKPNYLKSSFRAIKALKSLMPCSNDPLLPDGSAAI